MLSLPHPPSPYLQISLPPHYKIYLKKMTGRPGGNILLADIVSSVLVAKALDGPQHARSLGLRSGCIITGRLKAHVATDGPSSLP